MYQKIENIIQDPHGNATLEGGGFAPDEVTSVQLCRPCSASVDPGLKQGNGTDPCTSSRTPDARLQDVASATGIEILRIFYRHNETFRGKVQDRLMLAELARVRTFVPSQYLFSSCTAAVRFRGVAVSVSCSCIRTMSCIDESAMSRWKLLDNQLRLNYKASMRP